MFSGEWCRLEMHCQTSVSRCGFCCELRAQQPRRRSRFTAASVVGVERVYLWRSGAWPVWGLSSFTQPFVQREWTSRRQEANGSEVWLVSYEQD